MSIVEISPSHVLWRQFEGALAAERLPTEDSEKGRQCFFAAEDGSAFGGFSISGGAAFLRSIVVPAAQRSAGRGRIMLALLLARARQEGASEAWLMTTTAKAFFTRYGFTEVARDQAPPVVAESAQFRSLCPPTAVLMCRQLA